MITFIEESGGIQEYKLDSNGLQILVKPDHSAPVVACMITYRVGSRNETTGLTGATHFLEHLMFKGSTKFNKDLGTSVFNVLQDVGARMNATTWLDRTNYYELLPSEHLDLALDIESDRMRNALLRPEDVESEKTVILNEFDRGENESTRKLYHDVWASAFVAHPYHHPTIGWRSDIENVTSDSLRGFYDQYYWPSNATLSVVGDIQIEECLSLIANRFGKIEAGPVPPELSVREPEQRGERRVVVRQAGEIGSLMIAYKGIAGTHEDSPVLDVLSVILGTGKSSRLYSALIETGLSSGVNASNSAMRDPGLFYVFASLNPEVEHAQLEEAIFAEISSISDSGVTDAEVETAVSQLLAMEAYSRDGAFSVVQQLNEAIATGDWKLYSAYGSSLESVTADEIRRAANTYLVRDRCIVGSYIPE